MYGDPDSRIPKFLLMECGILGFGIRNTTQEVRNPTDKYWNPVSGIQDCPGFPYIG